MKREHECHNTLAAALEQCRHALHAAQTENLRLSERLRWLEAKSSAANTHASAPAIEARPQLVRWHSSDNSVFIDDQYLVRGVAGAILWKLLQAYLHEGLRTFTNVELRMAPDLCLPQRHHNLEVRLSMLEQRLAKLAAGVQLDRSARGHISLKVDRAIELKVVDDAAPMACKARARVPTGPRVVELASWMQPVPRAAQGFSMEGLDCGTSRGASLRAIMQPALQGSLLT